MNVTTILHPQGYGRHRFVAKGFAAVCALFMELAGAGLEKLAEQQLAGSKDPIVSVAEVRVPMFLDRWDKYGFRFYYGPFVKPRAADHREVAED